MSYRPAPRPAGGTPRYAAFLSSTGRSAMPAGAWGLCIEAISEVPSSIVSTAIQTASIPNNENPAIAIPHAISMVASLLVHPYLPLSLQGGGSRGGGEVHDVMSGRDRRLT